MEKKQNDFPVNVFPDINNESREFPKYKKENISEDYISENFEKMGWSTYRPYADSGLDLIATKKVYDNKRKKEITITRFIQIKTRALVPNGNNKEVLGYTLSPKDFRDDPRGIILLFNDNREFTGSYDVFIIPMYEYFKFFYDHSNCSDTNKDTFGNTHFSTKSFRQENNKINSLYYYNNSDEWKFSKYTTFNKFHGIDGYNIINNTDIEDHFTEYQDSINKMKQELYYNEKYKALPKDKLLRISKLNNVPENEATKHYFNKMNQLFNKLINETDQERKLRFNNIHQYVLNNVDPETLKSAKKYEETQRRNDNG